VSLPDAETLAMLVEESGFKVQAVAFALGRFDYNVAEAMAYLAALAEEDDGPLTFPAAAQPSAEEGDDG
jgi:hypothetical protein